MKEPSTYSFSRLWLKFNVWGTFYLLLLGSLSAVAQVTSAPCNTFSSLTNPTFGSLSVTSSQRPVLGGDEFSNKNRLIDNDLNNAASYDFIVGGSAWIEVKDNGATGSNVYPAGSFAGFVVDNDAIALLGTSTISTYLGETEQDVFPSSSLVSVGVGTGRSRVGSITSKPFDRVRLTFTAIGVGEIDVYYAVVQRFCGNLNPLACNTPTVLNSPAYPVTASTTFSGINVGTVSNPDAAISADGTDFAQVNLIASVGSATFSIKDQITNYDAGTFAGFDISRPGLINLGVLDNLTIATYRDNSPTGESVTGGSLVSAGSTILSGSGRGVVGFITTQPFDEVRLIIGGVNVSGNTNIYGLVLQRFCPGQELACNTPTIATNPSQPVYVNGKNTGINTAVCAACAINNSQNAVDSDLTNSAQIVLTAGVATDASFAVANAVDTYQPTSFAGFDIETNSLLTAGVLSSATITLYNNGNEVQTSTGNALIVGATSPLLGNNRSRQLVGIIATAQYDEVKITFNQVVNANLGTINIYGAVFQRNCSKQLVCGTSYTLNNPEFPVVINFERTGVTGAVGATTAIENPYNVISASTTDFARITNTASALATASISVLNAVDTYPTGTFAGFALRRITGIVNANLFSNLTVRTYLNNVEQESRTAGGLLDLSISLFSSTDFITAGFITTKPFDEVRLSVTPLVGADVSLLNGGIDVFGAVIDTRTSSDGNFICFVDAKPDFNVTNRNQPVSGNVSTNDKVATGTTYGTPVSVTQPAGATPTLTLNPDGTYTFNTSTAGVYVYNVPVCAPGQSSNCPPQPLTITVLDPAVNTNPPVANTDIATTVGPNPVTVNVKANDGVGNPGGTLGTPTITTPPANGSATVNGDGNVVYTPNAGFVGTDQLTYQVCEQPGGQCATATVSVTVKAQGSANTTLAADDYVSTAPGVAVSGNVKTNDTDPEGNAQTVTAQNTTVSGKGTLVLNADGSFNFTPVANFTGPVDFTYVTCDNGTPQACANGTLHVLVTAQVKPDLTPIINLPAGNFTSTGSDAVRNFTVRIFEGLGQPTSSGNVVVAITVPIGYTIAYDASLTSINVSGGGTVAVNNTNWAVTSSSPDGLQIILTIKPGQFIPGNGSSFLGFTITRVTANSGSTSNITTNVFDDPNQTYDSNPLNNIFARNINAL